MVSNFDSFYFQGCGPVVWPGKECVLQTKIPRVTAPVRVTRVWATGFELFSLPGHPEGPGRFVKFEFLWNEKHNGLVMDVSGEGPKGGLTDDPWGLVDREFVHGTWGDFAWQIGRRYALTTLDAYLKSIRGE